MAVTLHVGPEITPSHTCIQHRNGVHQIDLEFSVWKTTISNKTSYYYIFQFQHQLRYGLYNKKWAENINILTCIPCDVYSCYCLDVV